MHPQKASMHILLSAPDLHGAINRVLAHLVAHISIFDDGFPFRHPDRPFSAPVACALYTQHQARNASPAGVQALAIALEAAAWKTLPQVFSKLIHSLIIKRKAISA